MPITVDMMRAAAASGLSVVCASCTQYWNAREQGVTGDVCAAAEPCGGPLLGRDFPHYRGIMGDAEFAQYCFACGARAVKTLQTPGQRVLGVCVEHLKMLADAGRLAPIVARATAVLEPNWLGVPTERLRGKKLPEPESLGGKILAQEKAWADERGEDFDPLVFGGGVAADAGSDPNQ